MKTEQQGLFCLIGVQSTQQMKLQDQSQANIRVRFGGRPYWGMRGWGE
jgi:hypothetical protein